MWFSCVARSHSSASSDDQPTRPTERMKSIVISVVANDAERNRSALVRPSALST